MSTDGYRTTWYRNIAGNINRLSRVHKRYRQTDDSQTDGRRHIANVNVSVNVRREFKFANKNSVHVYDKI